MAGRGKGKALTAAQVAVIRRLYGASKQGRRLNTMGQVAKIIGVSTATAFKAIHGIPPYEPAKTSRREPKRAYGQRL